LIKRITPYLQLTKPVISISVTVSALTGFLLFQGFFTSGWLFTVAGVLLLSSGSAAINHVQEAGMDRLMERTRYRPVPGGLIKPGHAAGFSALLIIAGLLFLMQLNSNLPLLLGLANVVLYNLVYTPLKKITPFAVFPGAMVGAVPPVIGWTAAGGSLVHHHILLLAFLFFIGQIPHFWLILLKHAGDYEKTGFPSLTKILSMPQLVNLTLIWVLATAMASVMLTVFGIVKSVAGSTVILSAAAALVIYFYLKLKTKSGAFNPSHAFIIINLFYMVVMVTIIGDALFMNQIYKFNYCNFVVMTIY
jgi:heme o synthase